MGWEKRGENVYYYHKVRCGSRVVSQYVGNSETPLLFQTLATMEREDKAERRAAAQAEMMRLKEQEKADAAIFAQVELLTDAVLLTLGFHQHKGTWRRKRYE